jgi:c-di-GMP-binding flagellar brake protein YcgR
VYGTSGYVSFFCLIRNPVAHVMEAEAKRDDSVPTERRAHPRYTVDGDSQILFVNHGLTLDCKITDLSHGGCRIYTQERVSASPGVRVEISFKINGITFRLSGVLRWTDRRRLAGIRFTNMTPRRQEELAEAIAEIEAAAAKAQKAAEAEQAAENALRELAEQQAREQAARQAQAAAAANAQLAHPGPQGLSAQQASPPAPSAPAPVKRERRSQVRHEVDTSATIHLVKGEFHVTGRILDLSLSGCRIGTEKRFQHDIYTRVETEFRMEGLPFLLGGVVQTIHNRFAIGIRFLDVSARKREQLLELIEEIAEMRARESLAVKTDAREDDPNGKNRSDG